MTSQTSTTENSTPQTTHRQLVESFRQKILEKTDGGDLIIGFLISAVKGEFPDFKPNHKLEAVRLLEKFAGVKAKAYIDNLDMQPPTRRERRDARRADRRISSEIAQIAQKKTDNGDLIIDFLIQAMQGELKDFRACHRMSASKELLHCVFDFVEEDEDAEPVETPEEKEERLRREENKRKLAENYEFSLHGPVYYKVYPSAWPCPCEDRRHDCKGNELTEEEIAIAVTQAPSRQHFIRSTDTLEAFKERYKDYLARINPGKDLFSRIRWKDDEDP